MTVLLQTVTPWSVDTWEVPSVSDSSNIIADAEGPGREWRRWRRMRKLGWWNVKVGSGGMGFSYVEEGGRRLSGHERPGPSPAVMAINLLLSSNGDILRLSTRLNFYGTGFSPK